MMIAQRPDKPLLGSGVTLLDDEFLTLKQLYRDRADAENVFDELTPDRAGAASRRRISRIGCCSRLDRWPNGIESSARPHGRQLLPPLQVSSP
jgi:hypothetical protein